MLADFRQLADVSMQEIAKLWLSPKKYGPATLTHPRLGVLSPTRELPILQFAQALYRESPTFPIIQQPR